MQAITPALPPNALGPNRFLRCKVSAQAVDFLVTRSNPTDQHFVSLAWFSFTYLLVHEPSSVHSMPTKRSSDFVSTFESTNLDNNQKGVPFDRVAIFINQGALYLFRSHASGKHGRSKGPRGVLESSSKIRTRTSKPYLLITDTRAQLSPSITSRIYCRIDVNILNEGPRILTGLIIVQLALHACWHDPSKDESDINGFIVTSRS